MYICTNTISVRVIDVLLAKVFVSYKTENEDHT